MGRRDRDLVAGFVDDQAVGRDIVQPDQARRLSAGRLKRPPIAGRFGCFGRHA